MSETTGELIKKDHSLFSSLGDHVAAILGLIFSLAWVSFILLISYWAPVKQPIFTPAWYSTGIIFAIIPTIAEVLIHLFQMIFGRIRLISLMTAVKDLLTTIAAIVIYQLYPFDFGKFDNIAPYILLLIGVLGAISAFNNIVKYTIWDSVDTT